jgi:BirA family biotin operon repressor/biotin-[acetyl-CoA-carboxylase] ligase
MKSEILKILRQEEAIVSGETLSARLRVSRVSIWKHIRALQESGYDIQASAKGYRLIASPDVPYPWEFPHREAQIHHFPEVDSTMRVARELARKGCDHLTVVAADSQRKGRGRLTRTWHSETGGLYFTVVVRPILPPVLSPRVNFAASLVLVQTLNCLLEVRAAVKWPNDVLVGERKVAGILSEMEAELDRIAFINVGLGVNVNNDPAQVEPRAVSLQQICERPVSRKAILGEFMDRFEDALQDPELSDVIEKWKVYTTTLDRRVRIATVHESVEGKAVDVDEKGSLLLKRDDGSLTSVLYGDCFHL